MLRISQRTGTFVPDQKTDVRIGIETEIYICLDFCFLAEIATGERMTEL